MLPPTEEALLQHRDEKPRLPLLRSIALAIGCAMLPACGDGGAVAQFTRACVEATNMDESLCECVGEKAAEELSDKSFDLLVATLNQDDEEVTRLRGEVSLSESLAAGLFMTRGPALCAEEKMDAQ
jgi:hypothetical protein